MRRFNRMICAVIICTFLLAVFSGCKNATETQSEPLTGKTYGYAAKFIQAQHPWLIGTTMLSVFLVLIVIILSIIKRYERNRLTVSVHTRTAELEKAEKMTNMLNQMAVLFLSQDNKTYEEKLSSGVELIAGIMDLDRVSVWRNIDTPNGLLTSQIYRWDRNSGGTTPPNPELVNIPLSLIYPHWKKVLVNEETINGPIRLMNPTPAFLKHFSVISAFVAPLAINNDEGWGFVLFEDRQKERYFDDSAGEALRSASFLFVNTIIMNEKNREISNIISKLNAVVSNYTGVVWSVDRDETITLFNGLYLDEIGIVPAFIEGKKLDAASRKGRHLDIINHVRKTIDEGHPQNWISNFDGKKFHARSTPIFDERGYVSSVVGSINDLTQMIELQEKLEIALEGAEKAGQIAVEASRAKSDFLSHMSHEIRTPLNAIIGMISIGLNTDDIAKKNYCFERADSASKHLLGIVNDILDMSKIEANKFELSYGKIDFEKMLMNITDATNIRAEEKNQDFIINLNSNVPAFIESDELRLSQVIINLLSNAIKFTPEKGTVKLNIEKMETVGDEDDVTLRVEVVDTGIGISKEQQVRLFTLFNQADSSITKEYGGTGLGLAISKKIIELLGGTIWVESELGKGARFIFTAKVKKLALISRTKLSANIKLEDLRILAVDDSMETRDYFLHVMEALKLSCDVANCGAEALEMIKNAGDTPYNIFFVDWQMPEMDGIELTKKIKEINGKNSIVIMISVTDWNIIEKEAIAAGVKHFVPKPLFPSALVNAINICVGVEFHEPANELLPPTISRHRYDFKNHTLLIAEDVEINREIMSAILEETDVAIDYAENGRIAFSMFRENPEKYSLILMDVNMPEMDGYEATRQIRALDLIQAKDIPIVAMTANVFKEDVEKCLESGMNDHTGKPIDTSAILGMLKKYIKNPWEPRKMKNVHDLRQGIAWDESLLTGNALVDMQHQKIFERVSDLVQSCEDGNDIVKLQDTLEFLLNHTVRHFADEEALLLEYGYPNYKDHKEMHDEFKETVDRLVQRFKDNGSSAELSGDVNKIVVRWLINHIQYEDKKISDYIRALSAVGEVKQ